MFQKANAEQKHVVERVVREVQHHDTGFNVFFLTAHASSEKTFMKTAIIHKINYLNTICIVTAFSGIASTLLIVGRT